MRVIIAGGGTGGHIFPAVAIAHALQRLNPGTELLFVGANNRMEMEKVPQEGFNIIGLDIAGFNRSNMLKNLSLPFKIWKSHVKAKAIINESVMEIFSWFEMRKHVPVLNAVKIKLNEIYTSPHYEETAYVTTCSEKKIQKVLNGMASKMRLQNQRGCYYIEAINEFLAIPNKN